MFLNFFKKANFRAFSIALVFLLTGLLVYLFADTGQSGSAFGDYNGDGSTGITDVISLLLQGRESPGDPRLDYNADGVYSLNDALDLLLDLTWYGIKPYEVAVEPVEIDDFLLNPFRGFESKHCFNDWISRGVPRHPLCGTAQFRWYWDTLEPEDGQIRFGMIDSMIAEAVANEQRINIRVMCQNGEPRVPDWLRTAGAKGDYYSDGTGWQPDYGDPIFLERHEKLIKALAERYDGHPAVDFVDVGSIGRWAEWHTSETGLDMPPDSIQQKIIDMYLDNFKETPLISLIGDDFAMMYQISHGTGWRADCLGDMGGFSPTWNHMDDFYQQALDSTGANEIWERAPVVFETCWTMQFWYERNWDIDHILSEALRWHVTIMNNGNDSIPAAWETKVREFEKKMGYRFVLRNLSHPASVKAGRRLFYQMQWENVGVAPCYLDCPLAFQFRPVEGDTSWVVETEAEITGWLPGTIDLDSNVILPKDMPPGEYELAVGMLDPWSGQPRIRFAIQGRVEDGWYRLSRVAVR